MLVCNETQAFMLVTTGSLQVLWSRIVVGIEPMDNNNRLHVSVRPFVADRLLVLLVTAHRVVANRTVETVHDRRVWSMSHRDNPGSGELHGRVWGKALHGLHHDCTMSHREVYK